jgi:GntR family transcriptional regulator
MEDKDMHIILNNTSMVPIYEQLVEQVKSEILSGGLKENDVLPSVRALAGELRISALTVKKAYDRLEEDGFVVTVHGKGTYVAAANRQLALEARRKTVEDDFAAAIQKAHMVGFTKEEILEIVELILEDY